MLNLMNDMFGINQGFNPVGVVCFSLPLSQGRPRTANPGLEAFHPVGVKIGNPAANDETVENGKLI
jgi:hypothetical protein